VDKFDVYEQWQGATRDAQAALERFKTALGAWYCAGKADDPADLDAALRDLREAGLERWVADNEAGGGVDVLAVVAQGGDVCPVCGGTGRAAVGLDPETFDFPTCETCGGVGAVPAGEPPSGPMVDRLREALAFVKAQKRFTVHVWWKNAQHLNETGRVLVWDGGPELLVLTDLLTGERKTVNLADVFDVEVGE
jgi:hypothetical protein